MKDFNGCGCALFVGLMMWVGMFVLLYFLIRKAA